MRPRNEDRCGTAVCGEATTLVAVADGVSGYEAADVASAMAVDVTLGAFAEQDAAASLEVRLARAVQHANISIYDKAMIVPELRGMATTLTALAIRGDRLAAAHVGDSRLYLVRGGRALQLTKDHRAGRNALTRCVGRELIVPVDRITRPVAPGDVFVLCTDGVHNVVPNEALVVAARAPEPAEACRALVDAALARGADDNVTVAVVRIAGEPAPDDVAPRGLGQRLLGLVGRAR
ncbi:MAG TPA: protein phosphatase 2C domain-containing protein [Polyangia bacterium]|nr:protein phosphatase 2C domain-containing protein [Polyangia bacterium]